MKKVQVISSYAIIAITIISGAIYGFYNNANDSLLSFILGSIWFLILDLDALDNK